MDLTDYKPRYITFDCYGTLTNYQMSEAVRPLITQVVSPQDTDEFIRDFRGYRMDEVLGPFKLYRQVLRDSWQRTCNKWRIQYRAADVDAIVQAVGSWGPHADVPEPLTKLATEYPLVILSNAEDAMLEGNVAQLGVDFHRVFTAEQVGAYKPRYAGFEYMVDQLGCRRDEILHVTSHIWYDIIPCYDLGIEHKVYVNRGYDPGPATGYEYAETSDLGGLPALLGL